MKDTNHIRGTTIMDCLSDLDDSLLIEAEADPGLLPQTAGKRAARRAARQARRAAREENAFARFAGSGFGAVAISLVVAFALLAGVIHAGNRPPTGNPAGTDTPSNGLHTENLQNPSDILLEGRVPFAPEAADYTISTDRLISSDATVITVTMTANRAGIPLSAPDAWRLENLTDPNWGGSVSFDELDWEMPVPEGDDPPVLTHDENLSVFGWRLSSGVYRLHAAEYNGEEYQSVAFCEFAVTNEANEYKTWTEADFADAVYAKNDYTISTDAQISYGTGEIRVTFRSLEESDSLGGPTACYLVKLDGTAGAGACFPIYDGLEFAVEPDRAAGESGPLSFSQDYQIVNPAAATPGRYRIYNVDHHGVVRATCEFEIVGNTTIAWPGEDQDSTSTGNYTIQTQYALYPIGTKTIVVTAKGKNPGEVIPGYHSWYIEDLDDPDATIVAYWTAEAIEMQPVGPEEYSTWSKSLHIEGGLPEGRYRVHHREYDPQMGGYVTVATYDFRVAGVTETGVTKSGDVREYESPDDTVVEITTHE